MKFATSTLWLPKRGNTDEEYEDAAAPVEPVICASDYFRCAVADGATETSFSGLWARLLVEGFLAGQEIESLRKQWHEQVDVKQLPWYAAEKAQSGAYAALVCLEVYASQAGACKWKADAIGDSCLVVARGNALVEKFPLSSASQFNSSPFLLSSNLQPAATAAEQLLHTDGGWQVGDVFYLMTDALAHWVYKRDEEHGDAAVFLRALRKQADLEAFVKVQRELTDEESKPLMRNDDVTLLRLSLK